MPLAVFVPSLLSELSGVTAGSVLFVGSDLAAAEDNGNLFWDNTNNRLGIGNAAPDGHLHVTSLAAGNIPAIVRGHASQNDSLFEAQNSGGTALVAIGPTGGITAANTAAFATVNQSLHTLTSAIDSSGAGTFYGTRFITNIDQTGAAASGVAGAAFSVTLTSANKPAQIMCFNTATNHIAAGTLGQQVEFQTGPAVIGGHTTDLRHVNLRNVFLSSGTVGTQYGIYFTNFNSAATNYILYSEGGQVLLNSGGVGVTPLVLRGAASQSANLQEWQNSAGTALASMSAAGLFQAPAGSGAAPAYSFAGDPNTGIINTAPDHLGLVTGGTERVRLYSDGVLWGFHGLKGLILTNTINNEDSTETLWTFTGGNVLIGAPMAGDLIFRTGVTNQARLFNSGHWSLGTTSDLAQLAVVPQDATTIGQVIRGAASQSANLQEWQNSSGVALARVSAGGAISHLPGNGAEAQHGSAQELLVLSTSGTTTDTTIDLPAGAIILAVTGRITTTIATATDWSLGDATVADRFSDASGTLTAGTTVVGMNHWKADRTTAGQGPGQATAAKVRVTTTGTPSNGAIRITVHFMKLTAPTA